MKASVQASAKKSGVANKKAKAPKTADSAAEKAVTKALKKPSKKAAAQLASPAAAPKAVEGRRIQVRKSGVHGKGVFAAAPIKAGELVIEYLGELISWDEALRRHPHDPSQPDHTFYFHIDDQHVIDGKVGGNASRWINHACEPNLEAEEDGERVFIKALRDIKIGEELFFDYGLVIDERYTPALKKRFACHCGSAGCRGTMLAPKRGSKTPKASA